MALKRVTQLDFHNGQESDIFTLVHKESTALLKLNCTHRRKFHTRRVQSVHNACSVSWLGLRKSRQQLEVHLQPPSVFPTRRLSDPTHPNENRPWNIPSL